MKKSATVVLAMAMTLWGYSAAVAQAHGGGKPAETGRPAQTGLEHAEATANTNGQRGIENAEAKQASDKDDSGKKLDKGKAKGKKHGKAKGQSKYPVPKRRPTFLSGPNRYGHSSRVAVVDCPCFDYANGVRVERLNNRLRGVLWLNRILCGGSPARPLPPLIFQLEP